VRGGPNTSSGPLSNRVRAARPRHCHEVLTRRNRPVTTIYTVLFDSDAESVGFKRPLGYRTRFAVFQPIPTRSVREKTLTRILRNRISTRDTRRRRVHSPDDVGVLFFQSSKKPRIRRRSLRIVLHIYIPRVPRLFSCERFVGSRYLWTPL